jgi:hypothetical protein
MFNLFKKKDPLQKMRDQYRKMLEDARDLQRSGDIKGFAVKTAEAEALGQKIAEMERDLKI